MVKHFGEVREAEYRLKYMICGCRSMNKITGEQVKYTQKDGFEVTMQMLVRRFSSRTEVDAGVPRGLGKDRGCPFASSRSSIMAMGCSRSLIFPDLGKFAHRGIVIN